MSILMTICLRSSEMQSLIWC